ncbi:MAG: D-aminoacylase [Pacificimonas sp.]
MIRMMFCSALALTTAGCASNGAMDAGGETYDLVIVGGTIYDGTGGDPFIGDVAVKDGLIMSVGPDATGLEIIDAAGFAVAPGFINTHSWASQSILHDPRAMSDLKQGVTTLVMGEGWSMGPLTPAMREEMKESQGDIKFDIPWTTLGEYLQHVEDRGSAMNVASFVGTASVRMHVLGEDDIDPTSAELTEMQSLVMAAMDEGALGIGSALIYAPGNYAETPELVALAEAAGRCGGKHISHLRSEASRIDEALAEFLEISRESGAGGIVYHLKQAGRSNWDKQAGVLAATEAARAEGLDITATMYNYPASSTGLEAAMPLWVQKGGREAWFGRLQDPEVRARVVAEMQSPTAMSENRLREAGGGDGVMLIDFKNPDLRHLVGRTLGDVARERGQSAAETAVDLVIEDRSRVGVVYFLMSEENVARQVSLPWVSFGSDAGAPATEPPFTNNGTHPRAYGNIARLLGKYVRDEKRLPLAHAIRQLTSFSAEQMNLTGIGSLAPGMAADIVVFDPATVADTATFADPHSYAVGVRDVVVAGEATLRNGEPTGAVPGRFLKGPGTGRCLD